MPETKLLNCSFCGKSRDSVEKLIAGPNVYICNECIVLSYNIVQKIDKPEEESNFGTLPSPKEIKEHLDDNAILIEQILEKHNNINDDISFDNDSYVKLKEMIL